MHEEQNILPWSLFAPFRLWFACLPDTMRMFRLEKRHVFVLVVTIAAILTFVEGQTPSATPKSQTDCSCKVNKKCAPASECAFVGYIIGGVFGGAALIFLTSYIVIGKVRPMVARVRYDTPFPSTCTEWNSR